jgi:Domain of unknown function (DUF6438)
MEIVTPRRSRLFRLLTAVCIAAVVGGCESGANESQTVPSPGLPNDASIEFVRDGCFGTCPVFAVTVRADGTLRWVGRHFVAAIGERQGVLQPSDVFRLFTLLDDARFDNWFVGAPSKQFAQRVEASGVVNVVLERELDGPTNHLTVTQSGISRRLTYSWQRARLIPVETALLNLGEVPLWIGERRR